MLGKERAVSADNWDAETARKIAEGLKDLEGPLLPILHEFNERFGFIRDEAIVLIADVLNLTRAEVQGVVGFYHDFRREPAGHWRNGWNARWASRLAIPRPIIASPWKRSIAWAIARFRPRCWWMASSMDGPMKAKCWPWWGRGHDEPHFCLFGRSCSFGRCRSRGGCGRARSRHRRRGVPTRGG